MDQSNYVKIIEDQANRALWEAGNVIDCIPERMWDKHYCDMPVWKHIYHMLHSLDQWYINPAVYEQPLCHKDNLNNLDDPSESAITRETIKHYIKTIKDKIADYNRNLTDEQLLQTPENCEWTRFTLILAQHRHLHSHMGMLMGFIIAETGRWPRVLGLVHDIPGDGYDMFA